MGNIFNDDFRDFLKALNEHDVKYLLVGGFSVILHGYPRTTGDMDIWVERSPGNFINLAEAFRSFGLALFDMTKENFLFHPSWEVFTFGTPPVAIDIMVNVKGVEFDTCFNNAVMFEDGDLLIRVIHKNDLIRAKKASGRSKDLNDLENIP